MAKLKWSQSGEKQFECGVSKGVLYPQVTGTYPKGVVWNGLISVNDKPSGAESTPSYADNGQYLNLQSVEKYGASIEAYMCPDEFAACDGSAEIAPGVSVGQQKRQSFGLSYVSDIGTDEDTKIGYNIHLIYGAKASPTEKSHKTDSDNPEPMTMSWELTTTPVEIAGFQPTAAIVINSTKVDEEQLTKLEEMLYGTDEVEPKLPTPDELTIIFAKG